MHRSNSAPIWRLKVINGCNRNDDLLLPLVPQPSTLQSFYTNWRDEDEERHGVTTRVEEEPTTVNAFVDKKAKKKTKTKTKKSLDRRRGISRHDWLHKIPHVVLGRHTCLPNSYRLRHACVSRLHCRIAYINDATTHKHILSKYPYTKNMLTNSTNTTYKKEGNINNNTNDNVTLFSEPYYLLVNCGSNPLYVNDGSLPCGQSYRLCENDIVAFLENPFDEEGGILKSLDPEDDIKHKDMRVNNEQTQEVVLSTLNMHNSKELTSPTSRELFIGTNTTTSVIQSLCPTYLSNLQFTQLFPVYVEVNGVRIAKYRPQCVPPNVLKGIEATNKLLTTDVIISNNMTQKQKSNFIIEHNRLVNMWTKNANNNNNRDDEDKEQKWIRHEEENDGEWMNISSNCVYHSKTICKKNDCLTSPLKCSFIGEEEKEKEVNNTIEEEVDIIGDVISPLRQRVVSTSHRGGSKNYASQSPDTKRHIVETNGNLLYDVKRPLFNIIPPRLPVYVFTRRSPSPEDFTRQAPSIGRISLQQKGEMEEGKRIDVAPNGEVMEWVNEETLVGERVGQERRKGGNPTRKKRRTYR